MIDIGVGLSLEKNPLLAAKEAAKMAKAKMRRGKITLALLIGSKDISYPALLKTVAGTLQGASLVGCSTNAIISGTEFFKHGLLLLTLGLPDDSYASVAYNKEMGTKTSMTAGEEIGVKLLHGIPNIPRTLGFMMSNGPIEEHTNFVYGIQERLGRSFPLVGTYMGDNASGLRNYLYFNQELFADASVSFLLGGKLNFGLGIRHGWKPIGKPHTITSAHDNVVEKIDGQPASALYEAYLNCGLPQLKKDLEFISVFYPLGLRVEDEEEYLLRSIVAIEPNGNLHFKGTVPKGQTVRLMIGTKETCLESAREAAKEAKQSLLGLSSEQVSNLKREPLSRFALIISSFARQKLLGSAAQEELKVINDELGGDIPMVGITSSGELAPLKGVSYKGQAHFRNQTISILIIEG